MSDNKPNDGGTSAQPRSGESSTPGPTDSLGGPIYSIVLPCYNEQDNIIGLLEEIYALKLSAPFEVIVVDDASRDASRRRLIEAKHERQWPLRIILHQRNRGQSAAICSGADVARGDWIITLDGDGQNVPGDIPKLIACSQRDAALSLICGHRQTRKDTWVRRMSSRVANAVRAALLNDNTPDTGCGLKMIRRDTFMLLPRFNHMHRFIPALVKRQGERSVSVAVQHRPRHFGRSNYGIHNRLWAGIIDIVGVIWLNRRRFEPSSNEEC